MSRNLNGRWTRREALLSGVGIAGAAMLPMTMPELAWADDKPPIATCPEGSHGNTVYIGAAVPRTGTYAVQGEVTPFLPVTSTSIHFVTLYRARILHS